MKEPIQTHKAPKAIGAYSQAIKSGDFLFISGQIPLNPETMEIEASTFEDSAYRVISNLESICKEAGVSLDDIVKLNIYLSDLGNFESLNKTLLLVKESLLINNINEAIKVLEESNIDDINLNSWLDEAKILAEANSNFYKFKIKFLDLME